MGERREERTSLAIWVDDWVFDNCKSFIIVFLEKSKSLTKVSSFVLDETLRYPRMKLEIETYK